MSRVEVVLWDVLMPIITKINGEPIREGLIDIHQLIISNAVLVTSNLGGGWHGHLELTMRAKDYMEHRGFAFLLPHNPGNIPQSIGSVQEQVLGTEKFQKNQALFWKYTAVDGVLKKQIVMGVESLLLSPLVYHLTGFWQVSALTMLQHLFSRYRAIEDIELKENAIKMFGPYSPDEPLSRLIEQLEKGR